MKEWGIDLFYDNENKLSPTKSISCIYMHRV